MADLDIGRGGGIVGAGQARFPPRTMPPRATDGETRMALPTTEWLVWHCGEHTKKPAFLITNICFFFPVARGAACRPHAREAARPAPCPWPLAAFQDIGFSQVGLFSVMCASS